MIETLDRPPGTFIPDPREFHGHRLLFLPGGQFQLPAIKIAQSMGFEVICADGTPHAPGFAAADEGIQIRLQDIEAMVQLGRSRNVSAVMTEQTDFAVPLVARIASRLGLRGIPIDVADSVTDKGLMRKRAKSAGILQPRFHICRTAAQAVAAAQELGLPLFYKPIDAQGSRGVGLLTTDNPAEIEAAFLRAASCSFTGGAIFEECLKGTECTVEGFVIEGKPYTLAISEKEHFPHLPGVARVITYPASFPREILDRIAETNEATIKAMGIPFGLTHAEFMVDGRGFPWLVEIAARGGGSHIASHVVPAVCGFHPTQALIRLLMGKNVALEPRQQRAVELRYLSFPVGRTLRGFRNMAKLLKMPGVIEIFSDCRCDQAIQPIQDDRSRHGFVITTGESRSEARALAEIVETSLQFEFEE